MRSFPSYELTIAWRYLGAKRKEGGISSMTWVSLIGITLGVMALITTLAVRSGFRVEFLDTILGANAHATVYKITSSAESGTRSRTIEDYTNVADRISTVPGVLQAAPVVRGQVMLTSRESSNAAEVIGISLEDLIDIPRISSPEDFRGDINQLNNGIAIGSGLARDLGVHPGDKITAISPKGVKTPFGTSPRVNTYEVVYIFTAGRYDIDRTRVYMPLSEAQSYFNRDGVVDQIEIMVADPDKIDLMQSDLHRAAGNNMSSWTWKDASQAFLNALKVEENAMLIILSTLVLIASMNITSGLIMLVKNKGRDIGILRTIGLSQSSIMRVFFFCGAITGTAGTIAGTLLGCLIALNLDQVMALASWLNGSNVWDASVRGIYHLPSNLQPEDVVRSIALSIFLTFAVTIVPAFRAARINPVEALRHE
jgi:lipoprotein-releasing system permease protein